MEVCTEQLDDLHVSTGGDKLLEEIRHFQRLWNDCQERVSRLRKAGPLHVLSARRMHALCSTCLHWSVPPLHYLTSSFREAGKPRSLLWGRRRTGSVSLRDQQVRKSTHRVKFVVSWQHRRHFCLIISKPLHVWKCVKAQNLFSIFVDTCCIHHSLPFVNKCYYNSPVSTFVEIWPVSLRVAKCG